MIRKFSVWDFFSIVLIILLTSCGGNSSSGVQTNASGGGIGGTGIHTSSVGPITAKGSITVNGVKFETTTARIFLDGEESSSDELLKVGMVVEVQGTLNNDEITGDATTILFDDNVQGPITDISGNMILILGQTVLVDSQTVIDSSIPGGITSLAEGDILEVSGELDELGQIRATFLQKKETAGEFEISGLVFNKNAATFMINNLTVQFSFAALNGFGGLEPANGDFVDVKGSEIDLVTGDLIAVEIEKKSLEHDEGDSLEIEGFVTELNGDRFTMTAVSGFLVVETNDQTLFEHGVLADIQVGTRLEVEGLISSGVLIAEEISFHESD